MPDNYSETVQLLERELCDTHISSLFECSHSTAANQIILECLMEQVNCKADILDLCERLLQLKNAPQLIQIIEHLRRSEYIWLHALVNVYIYILYVYTDLQIPETIKIEPIQDHREVSCIFISYI